MAEEATAPVEAPISEAPKSETISTNTNPEPAAPAQPAAPTITLTPEQQKFLDANGGWEKFFEKGKSAISNPAPKVEEPKVEQPAPAKPVEQPVAEYRTPEGYMSPTDIAALQYRNMLSSDSKYAEIRDYIEKGDYINDMRAMGMSPVDARGNVNDLVIRKFLDLKAQTVPAKAPVEPTSTNIPTVNYVEVGDKVETRDDAMAVLQQKGHPKYEEAKAFLRNEIFSKTKK